MKILNNSILKSRRIHLIAYIDNVAHFLRINEIEPLVDPLDVFDLPIELVRSKSQQNWDADRIWTRNLLEAFWPASDASDGDIFHAIGTPVS